MKLVRVSDIFGDETARYDLVSSESTLEDFIKDFAREYWGSISIKDNQENSEVVAYVKNNKIEINNLNYYEYYKSMIVHKALGNGGWGQMDIIITSIN